MPVGAILCPFTYQTVDGSPFGELGINAFGALGLMACPTTGTNSTGGPYQVFAAMGNATVPNGDVTSCFRFDGLTLDYSGSAAWQYT